jgi:hypothetical protein
MREIRGAYLPFFSRLIPERILIGHHKKCMTYQFQVELMIKAISCIITPLASEVRGVTHPKAFFRGRMTCELSAHFEIWKRED